MNINADGSPAVKSMKIERLPGKLNGPSKVKDTPWKNECRPWTKWPHTSNRMHTSAEVHFMYRLAKSIPEGNILNLGVGKGISTSSFAFGFKEVSKRFSQIIGIDLFNHWWYITKEELEKRFKEHEIDRYITLCQGFTHELVDIIPGKYQLIFIDADHHYETTKQDFELWSPTLEKGGLIMFHDSNMNTVNRVIEELDAKWKLVNHVWSLKVFKHE